MIVLLVSSVFGQAPTIEWQSTWGVEGDDSAYNIFLTDDGGYMTAGNTHQYNDGWEDIVFVKFDADGNNEWARRYGATNYAEYCADFIQTHEGGYLLVGGRVQSPYPSQYYTFRADPEGYIVWEADFGAPALGEGACGAVELIDSVITYYITGGCNTPDYAQEIAFVKLTDSGGFIWQNNFGTADGSELGYSICPAEYSNFVITGRWLYESDPDFVYAFVLVKVDLLGNIWWRRYFGEGHESCGMKVKQTADGGYIAVGWAKPGGYYMDWIVVRADSEGYPVWVRYFGGSGNDIAFDVEELPNNSGFVVAGTMDYDQWDACLLRLNADGDSLWAVRFGGDPGYEDARGVKRTDDGGYIIAGCTESYGAGDKDFYVVKFSPDQVGINENSRDIPAKASLCSNYPNPFNASTRIEYALERESQVKIIVYNILGQEVARLLDSNQPAGDHDVIWQADDLQSGIYFYKLMTDDYSECKQMVLLK
jgi:hypothetical protein